MWRFVLLRDWWNHQLDRFADRRIRRAGDRVVEGARKWLAENAERPDRL